MIILASDNIDTLTTWGMVLRNSYQISVAASLDELLKKLGNIPVDCVAFDRKLATGELLEAIKRIRKASGDTRIVLLNAPGYQHSDQEDLGLLKAGIRGFCTTDMEPTLILKVLDAVTQGQVWVRSSFVPILIDELSKQSRVAVDTPSGTSGKTMDMPTPDTASVDPLALLTPREREIATMVGEGDCNKRIAQRLQISEQTVKAHLTVIFRKLNVTDRIHLALRVAQG